MRSFTLMEIIIVVIILGILVTIGIPIYNNVIENAKAKVCETNQKVLLQAVEAYGLENDQLPGTLSDLKREHLRKAWAKVFKEENPLLLKLAYFIVDWDKKGLAYATEGWIKRYIGDLKYFTCPADETPPPDGYSYGINKEVANLSWQDYRSLRPDTKVIADSDTPTYTTPTPRHKKYSLIPGKGPVKYAIVTRKDKKTLKKIEEEGEDLNEEEREDLNEEEDDLNENKMNQNQGGISFLPAGCSERGKFSIGGKKR